MCTVVTVDDDRCDACGSRAFVFAERFLPRLTEIGATVIDLRHMVPA